MNKIHYSKIGNPDEFPDDVKTYWFPFAESLMRHSLGKKIVMGYVWLRWFIGGGK